MDQSPLGLDSEMRLTGASDKAEDAKDISKEDASTACEQMGFVEKDNVKLLGEDKMVQYYWDWFKFVVLHNKFNENI